MGKSWSSPAPIKPVDVQRVICLKVISAPWRGEGGPYSDVAHPIHSCGLTWSCRYANPIFSCLYQCAATSGKAAARDERDTQLNQNKRSPSKVSFPKGALRVLRVVNSAALSSWASSTQRHRNDSSPFQALSDFFFHYFPFLFRCVYWEGGVWVVFCRKLSLCTSAVAKWYFSLCLEQ